VAPAVSGCIVYRRLGRRARTDGGTDMATWHIDWAWGLPLIVLNVVIHVLGLGLINEQIVSRMSPRVNSQHLTVLFVTVMAAATLMVTALHAIEGIVWASAYVGLISARPCSTPSARSLPTATRRARFLA
jgi:hypothetical protein